MTTALFAIDIQDNMMVGKYSVPGAEGFADLFEARISAAREAGQPVIWVQNDGPEGDVDEPYSDGWQLFFVPNVGEQVVRKTTQNVFESNPELASELKKQGIDEVELIGMQSEYCVQASARGAKAAGFKVTLNPKLHATFHDGTPATNISGKYKVSASELAAKVRSELLAEGIIEA
jgi:nicotinamidase-related amidase